MAVQQAGMEREEQLRRGRQHDADIHETLHRHRKPQAPLGHHDLAHETIEQSPELRQVGIGAQLFRDLVDLIKRDDVVQVLQLV